MCTEEEARDRAKRLYQFVRGLIELRHVPVRKHPSEDVVSLDGLPAKPDCAFIARGDFGDEDQDAWLEVRCPKFESYPEPPSILADWLDPAQLADASQDVPELLTGLRLGAESEDFDDEDEDEAPVPEQEPPLEIKEAWEQYVESQWWPWKERTTPKYRAKKLYDDLFRMYQRQEQLGETFEIVAGFGLLSWRPTPAVEIQRHLVTASLALELDSRRQILTLRPTASGVELRLEDDMLDPTQRPPDAIKMHVTDQLTAYGTSIWDSNSLHELLKEYGNSLSADAEYDSSFAAPRSVGDAPHVTFAPAVILRRRGNEGLIGLIDAIIAAIDTGADIPNAVLHQVCIVEDTKNDNSSRPIGDADRDEETYFPLAANREQRKIVEHLIRSDGVVVEGPPGTGKSQTIANLICHLLATGQRILVTSHAARALQVLRDKIPEAIRPLCVQALSNDAKGMEALEYSVKGITDRHLTWNSDDSIEEIGCLTKDLNAARERLQKAINTQRAIREVETWHHEPITGHYSGTLAEIARQLRSDEERLGFITDEIPIVSSAPCSVADFTGVLAFLQDDASEFLQSNLPQPLDPNDLLAPDEFESIVRDLAALDAEVARVAASGNQVITNRLKKIPADLRHGLAAEMQSFAARIGRLRKTRSERWLGLAIGEIFGETERTWKGRLRDSQDKLTVLGRVSGQVLDARLTGHELHDPDALGHGARVLLSFLEARNGKSIGFRLLLPRHIKSALVLCESIKINGVPCVEVTALGQLIAWTEAAGLLKALEQDWAAIENATQGSIRRRIEHFEDLCEPLVELLELLEMSRRLGDELERHCGDSGPLWHDENELSAYLSALSGAEILDRRDAKEVEWKSGRGRGWVSIRSVQDESLRHALESAVSSKDASSYRQCYEQLCDLRNAWNRNNLAANTLRRLDDFVPRFAFDLWQSQFDAKWRSLIESWEEAWDWAKARTWLNVMVAPEAHSRASAQVREIQIRIQDILARLASAKAWSYCFDRLTENERVHLHAWSLAVRRIGKGTGKYANQHRRAARDNIQHCQPAIPAWIMPLFRVAESMRPGENRFDVAIIDEASQSGPEALALLFLADRVVVVGDDKQISPDPFTRVEDVNRLRRQYVSDLPANDSLDPQNSFFDLAKIRYPARIRLVEHFRCMPEIIQFSNDLCYRAEPLLPLRQFGAGRLEPVVSAVNVPNGFTKGKTQKVNLPEAAAIARKIAELLKDERYAGKTFGVISLLGSRQARAIEEQLRSIIDARELHARKLICGEAYAFQGDERDVMLLSMVSAPGPDSRIGVLAKGADERRFNVAMSRAKDQVWLYHSATLNDLSPNDLRSTLLRYCQHPGSKPQTVAGIDVEQLAIQARSANRSVDKAPGMFGSWFEVDVFLKIAARGYLIVPQYEVGGYFIDLAVVGNKAKLAVECDGEFWHGPEQWEKDAARQRDLERCGWPFVRIRESAFCLDPEAALESVYEELNRQRIYPQNAGADPEVQSEISPEANSEFEEDDVEHGRKDEPDRQDATLDRYESWQPDTVPNPRMASRESVIQALVDIIRVEGPATWRTVFDRYRIGLELGRLKGPTREALEAAAKLAVRTHKLFEWQEVDANDWYARLVSTPDSRQVRLRQRGPRSLEDIPPSEIAELLRMRDLVDGEEEWSFREVLKTYGLRRLTPGVAAHLRAALSLAKREPHDGPTQ